MIINNIDENIDYINKSNAVVGGYNRSFILDNKWVVCDDTDADAIPLERDISYLFEGMSINYMISMKVFLLNENRHNKNMILAKPSTFLNYENSINKLSRALRILKINKLNDLSENNIEMFFDAIGLSGEGRPLALRSNALLLRLLEHFSYKYDLNIVTDSLRVYVSYDFFKKHMKKHFLMPEDYIDWCKGGTLGGFPVELGIVALGESLKEIFDERTNVFIKSINTSIEKMHSDGLSYLEPVNIAQHIIDFITRFDDYGIDDQGFYSEVKREGNIRKSSDFKLRSSSYSENDFPKVFRLAKDVLEDLKNHGYLDDTSWVPRTIRELGGLVRSKVVAGRVALTILSGARSNEVDGFTFESFTQDEAFRTEFVSENKKTDHRIERSRHIAAVGYHISAVLDSLQWISPTEKSVNKGVIPKRSLFRINVPWKVAPIFSRQQELTKNSRGERHLNFPNWIIQSLELNVKGFDENDVPRPTHHRFRHMWVEIALRRFDGGAVPEFIRMHLLHSFGSYFTMEYMRLKIKEEAPQISLEYMRELIGRASHGHEELYGPVGRFILKRIQELQVVTDDELDLLVDEFDVIEPHEYGYCMIRKSQKSQAQCYDKQAKVPQFDAAKFEHCGGCVGSLRLASHRDTILRIGQKEAEVKASRIAHGVTSKRLNDMSDKILKLCETAINDFDKRIPLVDIASDFVWERYELI
jgi:hypothetical protein